jgi:predicted 3-demethylubiquinone-9 3-methyltransferase (glyoxalase superfamily)
MPKITPCLWFDHDAEDAARFYVSVFPNSSIGHVSRYGKEGFEHHRKPEGSVLTVEFVLDGEPFTALNGGPAFKLSEAVSFQIDCADQAEVDHYWNALSEGGETQQCGWLRDRFGLSWQVVPTASVEMLNHPDRVKAGRAMQALFTMEKIDIERMRRAFDGLA